MEIKNSQNFKHFSGFFQMAKVSLRSRLTVVPIEGLLGPEVA